MQHLVSAGFWRRFAAAAIDGIIFCIPWWIVMFLFFNMEAAAAESLPAQLIGLVAGIAYYVLFHASKWQATPGKRVMGVYVITAQEGARLSPQLAFYRYMVYSLPALVLMLAVPSMSMPYPDPATQVRLEEIQNKRFSGGPLTQEEKDLMQRENERMAAYLSEHGAGLGALYGFTFLYMTVNAFMIGLTARKTGIHDKICKTLAVRGRPENPLLAS